MRDLMKSSFTLLEREKQHVEHGNSANHDYSFVVFPAAKAYEGFLKKLFFELKLITKQQYLGDRFRIGKSLNPHLAKRYQWDWVYGRLVNYCHGEALPIKMWETWKRGRNRIFHYFPDHHEFIDLAQAEELIQALIDSMEQSLTGCKV